MGLQRAYRKKEMIYCYERRPVAVGDFEPILRSARFIMLFLRP
jgi:hypothetical protein